MSLIENKTYYCKKCKRDITFIQGGYGPVKHFFDKHPKIIYDLLNEEYPKMYLELSRTLRAEYMEAKYNY